MPCNCDHMKPNEYEREYSRMLCIKQELEGKTWKASDWEGYHPKAYSQYITKKQMDEMVALLCSRLKQTDTTKLSLEAQMWWRDHQEVDRKRMQKEAEDAARKERIERAEYERLRKKYGKK